MGQITIVEILLIFLTCSPIAANFATIGSCQSLLRTQSDLPYSMLPEPRFFHFYLKPPYSIVPLYVPVTVFISNRYIVKFCFLKFCCHQMFSSS